MLRKSHQGKLLNTEFSWDINSLSHADTPIGVHWLIEKDMDRESISKIKNGKTAETSGLVSEIIRSSTYANCHWRKRNALETENYRTLKLTDRILKTLARVVEILTKQKVD